LKFNLWKKTESDTMRSFKFGILYGFLVWLVPFVVAILIFPIHESNRIFFESIMPVSIAIATMIFSILYFRKVENGFFKEGIILGAIWFAMNLVIDLLMFNAGKQSDAHALV